MLYGGCFQGKKEGNEKGKERKEDRRLVKRVVPHGASHFSTVDSQHCREANSPQSCQVMSFLYFSFSKNRPVMYLISEGVDSGVFEALTA